MSAPQDTIVALTDTQRTYVLAYLVDALQYDEPKLTLADFDAAVEIARAVFPAAAVDVREVV